MTTYEKDNAMRLLMTVGRYTLAMQDVYTIAVENEWDDIAKALDEKKTKATIQICF